MPSPGSSLECQCHTGSVGVIYPCRVLMLPVSALPTEPRHRPGALPECAGHRGLWEALWAHPLLHQHRQEGVGKVDKGGAHRAAEAHV